MVWGAFKEVRRPQLSLVRDLISGVLHPVALAMPELIDARVFPGKVSGLMRLMYIYCGVPWYVFLPAFLFSFPLFSLWFGPFVRVPMHGAG